MGYRKVYLTVEEEEDIQRIKDTRESEGRSGAAFNAILKEGLAMVVAKEREVRRKEVVVGTTEEVVDTTHSSHARKLRRRRRG